MDPRGVDRDGEGYTQHYFDSRGIARVYAMTFRDGVWTLLRDAPDFYQHLKLAEQRPRAASPAAG